MATQDDRKNLSRRGASSFTPPVLEMPAIPEFVKRKPEYQQAWKQYEEAMDRWRKTLQLQGAATSVTSAKTVITTGGGAVDGGGVPELEADLHALYLLQWLWA